MAKNLKKLQMLTLNQLIKIHTNKKHSKICNKNNKLNQVRLQSKNNNNKNSQDKIKNNSNNNKKLQQDRNQLRLQDLHPECNNNKNHNNYNSNKKLVHPNNNTNSQLLQQI